MQAPRRSETQSTPLGPTTTRPRHTQPQPCKNCAALAPSKNRTPSLSPICSARSVRDSTITAENLRGHGGDPRPDRSSSVQPRLAAQPEWKGDSEAALLL